MEQVKKLREMTGAGVMDCKKALEATEGDFPKAIEFLRRKGIAASANREAREAKEGLITLYVQDHQGAMVELNCETDFVARTEDFQKLAAEFAKKVFDAGEKVVSQEESLNRVRELSGKVGEKMVLRRGVRLEAKEGFIAFYLHSNKKIGVLAVVQGNKSNEAVNLCGKDIAMQIAASRALFVSREEIPTEILEREREVFHTEMAGKPREIQEKIIQGKSEKWFEEVCLLDQRFIKNEDLKVKDYVAEIGQKAGQKVTVRRFVRFELGG